MTLHSEQNTEEGKDDFTSVQHQLAGITSSRSWCGYRPCIVLYSLAIVCIVVATTLTLTLTSVYLPQRGGSQLSNNSDATISAKIDEYIKGEMEKRKTPGVSLAVVRNGQIIHGRGYGYSNIEHQVPVKLETIFQSGSVGKQFTSMAVMMLVEKRKIELDDKMNKYFTDAPIEWNNITVRHLLTHTSGMTDYPEDFDFRSDYTEDDLYRKIKTIPLAFEPGEQWKYSNIGYIMLGILINRVTNQFYGDFLKEHIFQPLGMTTAQVINEANIIPNRASGYVLISGELENQEWVSPTLNTGADGSLYLTIYDMAKWDAALYGDKLLKNQTSFDIMWSPVKLNNNKTHPYGFGWGLAEATNGMRIIRHDGAWQGFQSSIIRVPDDKLTIVFFTNLNHLDMTELARRVLEIYNPQLTFKPTENKIEQSNTKNSGSIL